MSATASLELREGAASAAKEPEIDLAAATIGGASGGGRGRYPVIYESSVPRPGYDPELSAAVIAASQRAQKK